MAGIELDIPQAIRRKRRTKTEIEAENQEANDSLKELNDIFDTVSQPDYVEPSYDAEIIADVDEVKRPSWQEKVKDLFTEAPKVLTKKPRGKAQKEALQKETAFNLTAIMAIVLVFVSDIIVREPYKATIPNEAESQAIMSPIARIIARRLDLAGKISEDTADLIACSVAVTIYSNRVFWTVKEINERESLNRANKNDHPHFFNGAIPSQQFTAPSHYASETTAPETGNGHKNQGSSPDPAIAFLIERESERRVQ